MLVIKRHSCKTSLALHSKNNTRQGIFSFTEILMRADFLIGIVQQRSPYYFLLMESWASRLLSTVCGWFVQFNSTATTARKTQALQENLFCFQVISEAFKYFQTHSDILRYSQAGLLSRFKPLNVGLRESIMTPKFRWGATCTKGPDREMLATVKCWPVRAQLLAVIRT